MKRDSVQDRRVKVRLHFRSPLLLLFPPWVTGVTFGRHVFFRRRADRISARSLRHELIHVCQYAEHGFWGFLWRYLWRERHRPYRRKTFELEAFAHQDDPGYPSRRWPKLEVTLSEDRS